ncbi:hypothetical protein [Entomohabitans teleogrylli]|uniref:hypothetical protein n=1 Tax=Entomohabitans teleogrylli TaxID=1384589 RepID=UPI0012B6A74F|nr:hypothetical protein [Entomohabitans teleogrylli]
MNRFSLSTKKGVIPLDIEIRTTLKRFKKCVHFPTARQVLKQTTLQKFEITHILLTRAEVRPNFRLTISTPSAPAAEWNGVLIFRVDLISAAVYLRSRRVESAAFPSPTDEPHVD